MPKESSRKTDKAKSGTKPPAAKRRNVKQSDENGSSRRTLVVDVGGSGIKATLLNDLGKAVSERLRAGSVRLLTLTGPGGTVGAARARST